MNQHSTIHSPRLLALGAALGALLAATGIVEQQIAPLDESLAAVVNGEPVYLHEYRNYLETVNRDRPQQLAAEERRQLLERLVDERLLIQRATELGLIQSDPVVRKAVIDAMVENIVGSNPPPVPDTETLEAFYRQNAAYFSSPPLLHVRRMVFRGTDAVSRAASARESLEQGQAFTQVEADLGDNQIMTLPDSAIPASRLAHYLGTRMAEALSGGEPGAISGPLAQGGTLSLVQVVATVPATAAPLAKVRQQVLQEYQRRAGERVLREYLQELRDLANIQLSAAALQSGPESANR